MNDPSHPHSRVQLERIAKFLNKQHIPPWQRLLLLALVLAIPLVAVGVVFFAPHQRAKADVTTTANDNLRTGWYSDQANLSPSQVSSTNFGQLFSTAIDGQVYAQPLVSQGTLLVVTETNHVYGLDPVKGTLKWTRGDLGIPFNPNDVSCGDISPSVGITSTPVIDPATNIAYFTSKTYVGGAATIPPSPATYYMYAINVATGQTVSGFPVEIKGTAANDSTHTFTGTTQLQRPGLLLLNGVVYAAFGGHCDRKPFEGWVAGISTAGKLTTLWSDEAGVAQSSYPSGGIWQSGGGLVSDGPNQIVFASGNGLPPTTPSPGKPAPSTLGQSVVRLTVQTDGSLKATDFFSPFDASFLNQSDSDLGSGSPVALPPQYFGTKSNPRLMLEVGKQGNLYVMNADNLGGSGQGINGSDGVINRVSGLGGIWGKPAVWPGDGGYIYVSSAQGGGATGRLKAYKYGLDGNGNPIFSAAGTSGDLFGFGSSSPVITSSGAVSGSSVLWVVWATDGTGTNAQLRAYNPVPVNGTLQLLQSWPIGTSSKFNSPGVSDGRVYVGARDGHILGFGSPIAAPLSGNAIGFSSTIVGQSTTVNETLTANVAQTVTAINTTGAGFSTGTSTPTLPATLAAGATLTVPVTFAPTSKPGLYSGVLSATTSVGSSNFSIAGTAQSASASISVDPATISFGGVAIGGGSTSSTVTFSNTGAQPLTVNSLTSPTTPFSVSGVPANGSTIASNASVTVTITFTPTTVGAFTDNLTLNTSAGPALVRLSGNGGQPPKLQISPLNTDLGNVSIGGTAVATFTVANPGGVDLTITKSKPPASGVGFTASTTLAEGTTNAAGKSVTETVLFQPTTTGTISDTWIINSNDPTGQLQQVNFTGTGVAAPPAANVPLPSVYITNNSVIQPDTGTTTLNATVSLSAASNATVSIVYATKDATATAASGAYVAIPATKLTFAPGQTTQTVPITINGNASHSNTGQFRITLSSPIGVVIATPLSREYIVSPTPVPPPYTVTVGDVQVNASATANVTANFPVTLSSTPAPGDTVTVTVATADGTATTTNGDYIAVASTTLTFTSLTNSTQNVAVTVNKVATGTTNKSFFLNLTKASTNAGIVHIQGVATIVNGGGAAQPSVYADDINIVPPITGTTTATFTVQLGNASTSTVTVNYATHDSSATIANNDYVATSGTLAFAPGQTSKTVSVTVNANAAGGSAKVFYLNLARATGAVIYDVSSKCNLAGNVGGYYAYIYNESAIQNSTANGLVLVPVSLSSVVPSGQTVTVTVSTTDGTAVAGANADYIAIPATTLTFAEGQQTILVPVSINPNTAVNANKTFTLTITKASSNTTVISASATITIVSHP